MLVDIFSRSVFLDVTNLTLSLLLLHDVVFTVIFLRQVLHWAYFLFSFILLVQGEIVLLKTGDLKFFYTS